MSSSMEFSNTKILAVGLSCIDIIQTCNYYPLEDCEQKYVLICNATKYSLIWLLLIE